MYNILVVNQSCKICQLMKVSMVVFSLTGFYLFYHGNGRAPNATGKQMN